MLKKNKYKHKKAVCTASLTGVVKHINQSVIYRFTTAIFLRDFHLPEQLIRRQGDTLKQFVKLPNTKNICSIVFHVINLCC